MSYHSMFKDKNLSNSDTSIISTKSIEKKHVVFPFGALCILNALYYYKTGFQMQHECDG